MKVQCPKCLTEGKTGLHFLADDDDPLKGKCFRCGYTTRKGGEDERSGYASDTESGKVGSMDTQEVRAFLVERCLSRSTLESAGVFVTALPSGPALSFPLQNLEGEITKFKYRNLVDKKFSQSPGGSPGVFYLVGEKKALVVVEGEIDALAVFQAGYSAISTPNGALKAGPGSKGNSNDEFFTKLEQLCSEYGTVVIWQDADPPGMTSSGVLEDFLKCRVRSLRRVKPQLYVKDASDALIHGGEQRIEDFIKEAEVLYSISSDPVFVFPKASVDEVKELMSEQADLGVSTGWSVIDPLFKIRRGELSVVTGWPGSGKSEWLDALAVNLAKGHGWKFAMASLENAPVEHYVKLARKWDPMRRTPIEKTLEEMQNHIVLLQFVSEAPSIEEITRRVELYNSFSKTGKLDGLIIDPYNELLAARQDKESETEYISRLLGSLKRLARKLDMHIWIVAHPQKTYEKSRERDTENADEIKTPWPDYAAYDAPTLNQISGGAHWNNKADIGIAVERRVSGGTVVIHVRKVRQRLTGRTGYAILHYNDVNGTYS